MTELFTKEKEKSLVMTDLQQRQTTLFIKIASLCLLAGLEDKR